MRWWLSEADRERSVITDARKERLESDNTPPKAGYERKSGGAAHARCGLSAQCADRRNPMWCEM